MHGSSGCIGSYNKPTLINNVPSKEIAPRGGKVKKPNTSEDFWTTSTCDMDNSAAQSLGSISSTSATNQVLDPNGVSGSVDTPGEFVNHGLLIWNQTRQQWLGKKRSNNHSQPKQEPKLSTHCIWWYAPFWLCSWNTTYESLLGSNKQFPQAIPLTEMVDFLVDVWEQEGLYD